jgi:hypothetical protein
MAWATLNLEAGFPTVDEVRRRLVSEVQSAKARGVRVIKVIHGWGSSGEGGKMPPKPGRKSSVPPHERLHHKRQSIDL